MGRIDELMKQYCPDGVAKVRLSSVAEINRGVRVVRANLNEIGSIPVFQNSLTPLGYNTESNYPANTTFIISAGAAGDIGYSSQPFWAADDCTCFTCNKELNGRFLYYFLLTQQGRIKSQVRKASVPRLSKSVLERLEIPLPPLPVQQEIVRILDSFTDLQDNLQQELEARKKQYEAYREKLLSFNEIGGGIEWKRLADLCEIRGRIGFRGYTRADQVEKGNGPLSLSPANIVDCHMDYKTCTYITKEKYDESPEIKTFDGDIIFCKTASVGKVAYVQGLPTDATINPQLVVLKNIRCNTKYLYYSLETSRFQSEVKALAGIGSVPNIGQAKLGSLQIPVLAISKQSELVAQLDVFDNAILNLKNEINARQKQYEYYREQLLSF